MVFAPFEGPLARHNAVRRPLKSEYRKTVYTEGVKMSLTKRVFLTAC